MCTVSYLPLGNNNFILTSNRDESPMRKTIPPISYLENGVKIIYPKDELAGGTWIGISEKNRLVCLLNGGHTKHIRNEYYNMSRGIIVKKMLSCNDAVAFINDFDFTNIEPFTIVLVDWNDRLETYELVWDGEKKYFNPLKQEPKIWSSSTLYTKEMKQQRQAWFADWLKENSIFEQSEILKFHQRETGKQEVDIKMKRPFVETVSITSIEKLSKETTITYKDFRKNSFTKLAF